MILGLANSIWAGVLWLAVAMLVPRLPEARRRPVAMALAVVAVPLAGIITWRHGPLWGLVALVAATAALGLPLRRARD